MNGPQSMRLTLLSFSTCAIVVACAPDLKTTSPDAIGGAGGTSTSSTSSSSGLGGMTTSSSSSSSSSTGGPEPTCTDNITNGLETDVDCGGPACPKCFAGRNCAMDSDCKSGVCMNGKCAAAGCSDMVKNGSESDVDCGGITCSPCPNGSMCNSGADCLSAMCTGGMCGTDGPIVIGATVTDVVSSFSIAIPNGVQAGDLLVLFVAHGGDASTVSPPSGWNPLEDGSKPSQDPKLDIFYRLHTSGSSVNVTFGSSDGSAILAAFRNATYGTVGTLENASSDMVTTAQSSMLLFAGLTNVGGEVSGMPAGFTSIAIGNGNSRSLRLSYASGKPAGMYTLSAAPMGIETLPTGALAAALY